MGLRLNTNVSSLTAQRHLTQIGQRLVSNFERLSSGLRIASAADDPAGLGISERMRARIRSFTAAIRNTQDGISMIQVAEGTLGEISGVLTRMRELAVEASTGTLAATDLATLDTEYQDLAQEVQRLAVTTEFNDLKPLAENAVVVVFAGTKPGEGIRVDTYDVQLGALGLAGLELTSSEGAAAVLAELDTAVDTVASRRGSLGANQNRLGSAYRNLLTSREALTAAESRIRDVDIAAETASLARNTLMHAAAVSVLQQANILPEQAMLLLTGADAR